jgi:hypothetical protein
MTEAEWMVCQDLSRLVDSLRGKVSERKLFFLYPVAVCRAFWEHVPEPWRAFVEVVEGHADAIGRDEAVRRQGERFLAKVVWAASRDAGGDEARERLRLAALVLLRDIFGNPARPASLDPACLSPAVLAIGQAAHAERLLPSGHLDLVRLAVLADALEEAGCTDASILDHLRSPGPHVRGCWAIDAVLAKG